MTSLLGLPSVPAYGAAKSAVAGLTRLLATEFSPHGVRINAVAPGWFDTALNRQAFAGDPDRLQKILSRIPLGRVGEPLDVGYAAVYFCSLVFSGGQVRHGRRPAGGRRSEHRVLSRPRGARPLAGGEREITRGGPAGPPHFYGLGGATPPLGAARCEPVSACMNSSPLSLPHRSIIHNSTCSQRHPACEAA